MENTQGLSSLPFTPEQLDELAAFLGIDAVTALLFAQLCIALGSETAFAALLQRKFLLSGSGCSTVPELLRFARGLKADALARLSERGLVLEL